jgi:hypothetical protein
MAKKITADEQTNPAGGETLNPVMENPVNNENAAESDGETETATPLEMQEETLPAVETQPVVENLPPFVEAILKIFSSCESLYIDSQGGIYAPSTPAAIRGKATCYKNPYHRRNSNS